MSQNPLKKFQVLKVKDSSMHIHNFLLKRSFLFGDFAGYNWDVSVEHVERVKWYAPHIRHLVVDIKCKQMES